MMFASTFLLVPGFVLVAALLARYVPPIDMTRPTSWLASRWAPLALGSITALVVWWVWGSLEQLAVVHDERAYLLQASIFASGRWAAQSPLLPEFFEQMHVVVTPFLAPKYPPGHALMMVPGTWAGLPGLMPVILSGLAGGLLFGLSRRVTNPWVALIAWTLWLTAAGNLLWRASYYSEVTTSALWLAAWWALLSWRDSKRLPWLLVLSACIGWGAITRPLTMFVFAVPVAIVVLKQVVRDRAWHDLAIAAALGLMVMMIVPLWSRGTTGDWKTTPLSVFTRQYLPFDKPGFNLDSTPPLRPLPADFDRLAAQFRQVHRTHTPQAILSVLGSRTRSISSEFWGGWRSGALLFFIVGLTTLPVIGWFAVGTAGLLVASYLAYAHPPWWTLYYLELQPVLAFVTAVGMWKLIVSIAERKAWAERASLRAAPARSAVITIALVGVAVLPSTRDAGVMKATVERGRGFHSAVEDRLANIKEPSSIVFVRYDQHHNPHKSLVGNQAEGELAPRWLVYDRGMDNARLLKLVPDRAPYLFDASTGVLTPLSR